MRVKNLTDKTYVINFFKGPEENLEEKFIEEKKRSLLNIISRKNEYPRMPSEAGFRSDRWLFEESCPGKCVSTPGKSS